MTEFNHSFREHIFPFDRYNYLKMKDLERCPYVMWTNEALQWSNEDNKRMLLIALDRYADELQGKLYKFKAGDIVSMRSGDFIVEGQITIVRKYESKVMFEGLLELLYTYYPNNQLTLVSR